MEGLELHRVEATENEKGEGVDSGGGWAREWADEGGAPPAAIDDRQAITTTSLSSFINNFL